MPGKTFLPYSDTKLLHWASAFSSQISASAGDFGVGAASAASLASAVAGYSSALATATNESTRTKGAIAHKNTRRQSLREQARIVAALTQAHPLITTQQLSDLNLTVRKTTRTPTAAPALAPLLTNLSVIGRAAKFLISDAAFPNTRARKAASAKGAVILSYVGPTPTPVGDAGWKLQMQTARTKFTVQFASEVAPSDACWIAARWYNRRGEYSPACSAVRVYLQGGADSGAMSQADDAREAAELKRAA